MSTSFFNPITGSTYGQPSREELQRDTFQLDIEYRGDGINIDGPNIDDKIRSALSRSRLKTYAMFVNVVQNTIDIENVLYIRKPVRYFKTKKDGDVSQKLNDYLEGLYNQMDFDRTMLEYSRQAAYEGTLMARPLIDPFDNAMMLQKLTPSIPEFDIISDDLKVTRAKQLEYTGEWTDPVVNKTMKVRFVWDYMDLQIIEAANEKNILYTDPHGYKETPKSEGGMPFATLRYITDSNRFWGPFDGTLLSLTNTRSLLIADSIHRTQTSLYEILVLSGFSPDEAKAMAETRTAAGIVAFEFNKKPDQTDDPAKKIEYVSPQGMEPEKIFDLWKDLYRFVLTARGHTGKNFDSSRLEQTAEAQRLANIALRDKQDSRKIALSQFEKDIFKRIAWANNRNPGSIQIPEGTTVEIDWQPDEEFFNDATDKKNYYDFALDRDIMTGPDVIRQENPELSVEAATDKFEENTKFNKKFKEPAIKATENDDESASKAGDDQDG